MFYFWNICNISDSRAAILIRYISFDSILNFKLDQISSFAFWSNAYAKIRRIMISNSWFHILTSMSHTMDSHASFALNFFFCIKSFRNNDSLKMWELMTHIWVIITSPGEPISIRSESNVLSHKIWVIKFHIFSGSLLRKLLMQKKNQSEWCMWVHCMTHRS